MAIEEFTGELDQDRQPQATQASGVQQPRIEEFTGELDKETTQNPLMGGLARILELGGSGAEAFQRGTEGLRKQLEEDKTGIDKYRPQFMTDAAVKERQKRFTEWTKKQAEDIGYEPSTQLKDLGDNPLKVVPFVAERVITSSPDMAAAAFAFTPYVMTRSNEILNERLKNDGRTYEQATVGDVAAATTAAIGEATLERFATKRILPGGKAVSAPAKTAAEAVPAAGLPAALKRVGKEVGLQGGTESLEELSSYGGETIGTKKGFQPAEAGERMLEAGIVGAGLGGGARGAREVYDYARQPKVEELPPDTPLDPVEKPLTKGERKDIEQEEDRAHAAQAAPIAGKEPWEEILGPTPPAEPIVPAGRTVVGEPEIVKLPLIPIKETRKGSKIEGVEEINVDPNELQLSKDVPQFKEDADVMGVVEPLKGAKYDYVGTPPIQVWRRLDGTLEIISGRHRWDLAKRTGAEYIPAQVFDEGKGFNADMAAIMDAELNIRDGKGKVTDYVNYFTEAGNRFGLTKKDYEDRGLLDSEKGKRAYTITVQGSDDLIQALRGRQVKEDTAYRIADAVPNDPRLQALGLKLVNEKPLEQAINILHAAKTIEPKATEGGGEFDLFGFDDSAMKLAEEMGKLALEKQKALSADINTIERAGKQPAIAKKYGIIVGDPESVKAKVKELKAKRAAWDNWASDPELVDQIRRELAGEPAVEAAPIEVAPEPAKKPAKKAAKKKEESVEKTAEQQLKDLVDEYNKKGQEAKAAMDAMNKAKAAGEDYRKLENDYNERLAELAEIGQRHDKFKREYKATQEAGENLENLSASEIANLMAKHRDKKPRPIAKMFGKSPTEEQQAQHKKLMSDWNKIQRKMSAAQKIALERDNKAFAERENLPSFELEPEQKQTPADKKAAAEREEKEIADREREFFTLTPRTPEQGAGNYLQQDMIGAMGLTEAEFKKGIDKNSTEPGEPLVLRDVTMEESDRYNDEANAKVDAQIIDEHANMDNVKDVEVEDDVAATLSKQAQAVEDYVELASQGKVTAEAFMQSVREAAAKGDVEPDVYNAIEKIYKMAPSVLDGIRFEVATQGNKRRGRYLEIGHYQPLARMIRLFKDTSGVIDPATVRHEIAHTMEQMMTPEQKRLVIRAWKDELIRATRAEESDAGHIFFQNVAKFLHSPSVGTYKNVIKSMPNESYYQYVNPSEYWAVNAEKILQSREAGNVGLKSTMDKLYEGLKQSFGMSNFWVGNRVFDQILNGDRFSNRMLINYLTQTKMRNYRGDKAPLATWDSMGTNWLENQKYLYVDKYIDLLRAKQDIERMTGEVSENVDAYVKETLSHSRISSRIQDFMRDYVQKLADVMRKNNISQQHLHEFLLARHAPRYNKVVGARNPSMGDNAAGISTQDAENYIRALGESRRAQLEEAAKIIDQMTQNTRDILVDSGYETAETIQAWESMFPEYVPLYRKDLDYEGGRTGVGRGFQVQGKFSKAAMGSTKEVADISESIIRDHIRAIEKAERARVSRALYGMAINHPNPSFWMPIDPRAIKDPKATRDKLEAIGVNPDDIDKIMQAPKTGVIDPKTSLVKYVTSRTQLKSDNVLATRINGEDVYVVFNSSDPRARRLALAMKNMDLPDVEGPLRWSAYMTRWFAMVNTQLNPLFGLWNFARDVQGAMLNLSTTKLRGFEKEVYKGSFAAAKDIWNAVRTERSTGEKATTVGAADWYEFQYEGGTTGYKAAIIKPQTEIKALENAINEMNRGKPKKLIFWFGNLISDYNDMLENAVRLSAYKTAVANGMSKQEAANLAKNLTVNFNRKGARSQIAGSLYAFFNASVQGTSRMYQTLKGPIGKKIMLGGVAIGVIQAIMMELAGFEDDEPPSFVKEKNIIIPLAMFGFEGKKYVSLPMPLGYNLFPGIGRLMAEAAMGKGNANEKFFESLSLVFNSFNPLGSTGMAWQTVMPTPLDPLAAIAQNKDAFGRPIYKEDRATNPQVGYERTRESTGEGFKFLAKMINYATGGTADVGGKIDLTGDEIAYLAGQVTGGAGRELMKLYSGASDLVSGDEIPPYKIPLLGKLYGDAESKAAVKNRFYANVVKLAEAERTVKGMQSRKENVAAWRKEHPEAVLINMANRLENEISQLNKQRRELQKRGATIAQIKRIEDIKEKKMRMLNERYEKLR